MLDENNDQFSNQRIHDEGERTSNIMVELLDRRYDFVVVQSVGNSYGRIIHEKGGNYIDEERVAVDAVNKGMYASVIENNYAKCKFCSAKDIMDRIIILESMKKICE